MVNVNAETLVDMLLEVEAEDGNGWPMSRRLERDTIPVVVGRTVQ